MVLAYKCIIFFNHGFKEEAILFAKEALNINPFNPDAVNYTIGKEDIDKFRDNFNQNQLELIGKIHFEEINELKEKTDELAKKNLLAEFSLMNDILLEKLNSRDDDNIVESVFVFMKTEEVREKAIKLCESGRLGDAVDLIDFYLELYPNFYLKQFKRDILNDPDISFEYLDLYVDFVNSRLRWDTSAYELSYEGFELAKSNRLKEAIEYYDESLALDDKNAETWFRKGDALFTLGFFELSLKCFNESLMLDNDNDNGWALRGLVLVKLNRSPEAKACFKKALSVNPYNEIATKSLRYV